MLAVQEEQEKVAAVRQEAADELSAARDAAAAGEAERLRHALSLQNPRCCKASSLLSCF